MATTQTHSPVPTDTLLQPSVSSRDVMEAVRQGMPVGILNLVLASALREGAVELQRMAQQSIPPALASAALPGVVAGETLLPGQNGQLLPNFAGDLAGTLPLLEEVRGKYPRFRYRLATESIKIEDRSIDGFRVDIAAPATNADDETMPIVASVAGTDLPFITVVAVLEYLLLQPGTLDRVAFHFDKNTTTGTPDSTMASSTTLQ